MKKILFKTISMCLAAAAAAPAPAAAKAEPAYPDIYDSPLTFTALTDYAMGESKTAFADGGKVMLLDGENLLTYSFDGEAEFVDCIAADDGEDKFYYTLSGSPDVYILPDSPAETARKATGITLQNIEGQYTFNGLTYSLLNGTLSIWDGTSGSPVSFEGYSRLKKYGDSLYAMYGNDVMILEGQTSRKVDFAFSNYGMLTRIPVGDIPEKLGAYATFGQNAKIVNVAEGATATKIDLNLLEADGTFPVGDPRADTQTLGEGQALLLAEAGALRLIARGRDCYILNSADATDFTVVTLTETASGTTATVNADEYAHALPYLSNATRAFEIKPSETVEVLGSVTAVDVPVLAHDFYLVKNKDGDCGYVSAEFLNVNFPPVDEGGASTIPDPAPSNDDDVRTVVLVLVVILLVLIAAGYITWVVTAKHRKVKKNADGEVDVTKEQNDDGEGPQA